ncbi:MAG: sulfatase-like hydrolase/transferase [Clostridiales bacterium]|nr:sulfatase-like hydrolase/transferase [Clostridiales bacterium]
MKKPNIIIFNPDEMRADAMGHLGNRAAVTPNFDALISHDAVSFSNAYCQNTVCVPSRCSFFTGLYPHVRGHRTMSYLLHSGESSLFKELKEAGWYVWMNRRNDLIQTDDMSLMMEHCDEFFLGGSSEKPPGPENAAVRGEPGEKNFYSFYRGRLGVDEEGKNYTFDDEAVDRAVSLIENHKEDDQPLCIFLGLFYPHVPYQVEEPYFSAIDRTLLPERIPVPQNLSSHPKAMQMLNENLNLCGWSEEEWNELRSCYLGMVMKVDEQFGKICNALKKAGMYDDTDIYVLSDHGDFTGDYGLVEKAQNLMPDCLARVPLMVKPHKEVQMVPGIRDGLTELVDFYATVMDLAGVEPDHTQFGCSLRPMIESPEAEIRDVVFCEGGRNKNERDHCTEAKKSERTALFWPRFLAQADDVAHTKATMIRSKQYKYVAREYEPDEFYDLEKDPQELCNVVDRAEYRDIIFDMKDRMLRWYQETCDIVPFRQDPKMSPGLLLENARQQLSPEKFEEFRRELELGDRDVVALCEAAGVRII